MKILVPFFALVFGAGMTFAQDESASPAESSAPATEEKASATVQETSPSSSSSTMEATTPAPEKPAAKATKAEAATAASPAASPKAAANAKPAASAEPATASSKTAGKNLSPRDAENAWEAAIAKHDFASVEGMVASDFIGVTSRNKFANRSQMLGELKGDKDTYKSAKNEKLNVQMYGNNVAVVTGRAREKGTGKDGKAFDRTYLFTDTWMMRGGKWQCIAAQATKIKG
jgi:ketosteroid isomerase-like protein